MQKQTVTEEVYFPKLWTVSCQRLTSIIFIISHPAIKFQNKSLIFFGKGKKTSGGRPARKTPEFFAGFV